MWHSGNYGKYVDGESYFAIYEHWQVAFFFPYAAQAIST
jgi:hypothetical protein